MRSAMDPTLTIGVLAAAFVLTHVIPSHPGIRERLIARLGEGPYLGAYSLVQLVVWVPLVFLWWSNLHQGPALWALRHPAATHSVELVNLLALGLVGASLVAPAPSSLTAMGRRVFEPRGPAAITRHPLFVGIAVLSASHMVLNGWATDLLFWGSHLVLAVVGSYHQDQRLSARWPEYRSFVAQTSALPNPAGFARLGARGWLGFVAGALGALVIRYLHAFIWA